MATRHDHRTRCPVRNALVKWQSQQDKRRVAEVQPRLVRMATPSPLSSLEIPSRNFDRRCAARRPRPLADKGRDEVFSTILRMEREEGERDCDKHLIDRFEGSNVSRLVSPLRPQDSDKDVSVCKRSKWHESLVCEDEEDWFTFSLNVGMDDDGTVPSKLSTMSISEPTKQSMTQPSDSESLATNANEVAAPTSGQSIAEMLASMEKSIDVEYSGTRDDQDDGVFCGRDRRQFPRDDFSASDPLVAQVEEFFGMTFPWHSMIGIACCLVIGTSGFFIEELVTLAGFFSRRTRLLLSRAEQERIRDRMSVLQLELQGFQLLTSTIEVRSQTVLTELRQYMDRMRLDREKHQNMLAKEMQKLRRHILHVTHELVEQERESLQTQLEEIIKVQVINSEGANDSSFIVKAVDAEKHLDETTTETPIQVEPYTIMQESLDDAIASSPASACEDNGDEFCLEHIKVEPSHEFVIKDGAAVQLPRNVDNEHAHVNAENGHVLVGTPFTSTTGELVNVKHRETKLESPILAQEVNVEHVVEVESASLPTLEESLNKIDDAVASTSKETVNVMPSRNASGVSWDEMLLLVGIVFLAACVVLRAYNANRRKRWFEERRTKRNQRALRLAQRRARTMAEYREDRDEWHGDETGGDIEEVSLMTPIRDNKDDELRPRLVHQSSDTDTAVEGTTIANDVVTHKTAQTCL